METSGTSFSLNQLTAWIEETEKERIEEKKIQALEAKEKVLLAKLAHAVSLLQQNLGAKFKSSGNLANLLNQVTQLLNQVQSVDHQISELVQKTNTTATPPNKPDIHSSNVYAQQLKEQAL